LKNKRKLKIVKGYSFIALLFFKDKLSPLIVTNKGSVKPISEAYPVFRGSSSRAIDFQTKMSG